MFERMYDVVYTRKLGGSNNRTKVEMVLSESDLKKILNATESKFAYIVHSANLIEGEEAEMIALTYGG